MKSLFLDFWVSRKILINGSNNRFLSFIGFSSILGISIGVMALIVVMSVMNGFHFELKKRILDATSHIEITGGLDDQDEINQLINKIIDLQHVKAVSPYVSGEGLLSSGSINRGVLVKGIAPAAVTRCAATKTRHMLRCTRSTMSSLATEKSFAASIFLKMWLLISPKL